MTTEHAANTPKFEMANDSDFGHKIIFSPTRSGMSIFPSLPDPANIAMTGHAIHTSVSAVGVPSAVTKSTMNSVTYDDLSEAQLDQLQAANQRYVNFLGLAGDLDEQARSDRSMYSHLMTYSPAGNPCVSDEKEPEFLMAVTGLPREVCVAYLDT